MAVSKLTLTTSSDYAALSQSLISQLRSTSGTSNHVGGFLETLLGEIITDQLGDQMDSMGDAINAAKSTAEALEAANPKAVAVEETKADQKKSIGKAGDDKLYGVFEDITGD